MPTSITFPDSVHGRRGKLDGNWNSPAEKNHSSSLPTANQCNVVSPHMHFSSLKSQVVSTVSDWFIGPNFLNAISGCGFRYSSAELSYSDGAIVQVNNITVLNRNAHQLSQCNASQLLWQQMLGTFYLKITASEIEFVAVKSPDNATIGYCNTFSIPKLCHNIR